MPGATNPYGVPYPLGTDPVDAAGDIQRLAENVNGHITSLVTENNAQNAYHVTQDARVAAVEAVNATQQNQIDTNYLNRPDIFINNIPFGDKVHFVAQTWGGATDINGVGYVYFNPWWSNEFVNGPYVVCCNGDSNLQVVINLLAALTTPSYFQYQARWFDGNPAGNAGVTVSFIAVGTRA